MKRFIILVLLVILHVELLSVCGVIQEAEGSFIAGVLVKTEDEISISDDLGRYCLRAAGADSIFFHKMGYSDTLIALEEADLVILQRRALNLEGGKISLERWDRIQEAEILKLRVSEESGSNIADIISSGSSLSSEGSGLGGERKVIVYPGFSGRHTLVMLDGIALNNAGEDFDLSLIPLSLVEEIEIVEGGQLGDSGSGAMGSVINIRTKTGEKENLQNELTFERGSYGFFSQSFFVQGRRRNARWQITAKLSGGRNDFTYRVPDYWNLEDNEQRRVNNSFYDYDSGARLDFEFKKSRLTYKLIYKHFWRMLPGPVNNPELFYKARISGDNVINQLEWASKKAGYAFDFWYNSKASLYDNTRLEEPYSSYPQYCLYGKNEQRITGGRGKYDWELLPGTNLRTGLELKYEGYKYEEETNPQNSISLKERLTGSCFSDLEAEREIGGWNGWLKMNYRLDSNKDFSTCNSYGAAGGINLFEGRLQIQTSYGISYTLPSFYNLYWCGSSEATGNPDLLPELNRSMHFTAELIGNDNRLRAKIRSDRLKDMIIWIQTFQKSWKPVNIAEARVLNLSLEADFRLWDNIESGGMINYTFSEDRTLLENGEESAYYGKELIYTPDYKGRVYIEYQGDNFKAGLESELTGSQWTTRDQLSSEKKLEEYEIYTLFAGYEEEIFGKRFIISFRIQNLGNEFYQVYEYMPNPGRNYIINLKIEI